jgi:hypothetical protein
MAKEDLYRKTRTAPEKQEACGKMGATETNASRGSQCSRLEAELEHLKKLSRLGSELRVVWEPGSHETFAGQVKNSLIHVYEVDEKKAVETLRHEFLDYCVSQAIEPYKKITNRLISMVNEEAYRMKEDVVEGLIRLLRVSHDEVRRSH